MTADWRTYLIRKKVDSQRKNSATSFKAIDEKIMQEVYAVDWSQITI